MTGERKEVEERGSEREKWAVNIRQDIKIKRGCQRNEQLIN